MSNTKIVAAFAIGALLSACAAPVAYYDGQRLGEWDRRDLPADSVTVSTYRDNDSCMSYSVQSIDGVEVNLRHVAFPAGSRQLLVLRYLDAEEDAGSDFSGSSTAGLGALLLLPIQVAALEAHEQKCREDRAHRPCLLFEGNFLPGRQYEVMRSGPRLYHLRDEATGDVFATGGSVGEASAESEAFSCADVAGPDGAVPAGAGRVSLPPVHGPAPVEGVRYDDFTAAQIEAYCGQSWETRTRNDGRTEYNPCYRRDVFR